MADSSVRTRTRVEMLATDISDSLDGLCDDPSFLTRVHDIIVDNSNGIADFITNKARETGGLSERHIDIVHDFIRDYFLEESMIWQMDPASLPTLATQLACALGHHLEPDIISQRERDSLKELIYWLANQAQAVGLHHDIFICLIQELDGMFQLHDIGGGMFGVDDAMTVIRQRIKSVFEMKYGVVFPSGDSDGEDSEESRETDVLKTTISELFNLIDENREKISCGDYVQMMNRLKILYDSIH
jgi:hypothetical protein